MHSASVSWRQLVVAGDVNWTQTHPRTNAGQCLLCLQIFQRNMEILKSVSKLMMPHFDQFRAVLNTTQATLTFNSQIQSRRSPDQQQLLSPLIMSPGFTAVPHVGHWMTPPWGLHSWQITSWKVRGVLIFSLRTQWANLPTYLTFQFLRQNHGKPTTLRYKTMFSQTLYGELPKPNPTKPSKTAAKNLRALNGARIR